MGLGLGLGSHELRSRQLWPLLLWSSRPCCRGRWPLLLRSCCHGRRGRVVACRGHCCHGHCGRVVAVVAVVVIAAVVVAIVVAIFVAFVPLSWPLSSLHRGRRCRRCCRCYRRHHRHCRHHVVVVGPQVWPVVMAVGCRGHRLSSLSAIVVTMIVTLPSKWPDLTQIIIRASGLHPIPFIHLVFHASVAKT